LRPHQKEALKKLRNGSILSGGVGTGKSMVAAAYYVLTQGTRPVCVVTTAKKRDSLDWNREFARFAIGTEPGATVAGVLTVDSWNNIHKYEDRTDTFFIFDEQRLVGSGGWVKSFLRIARSNPWMLLSATPGDVWLDYVPVFLAHGFYKNRTEFKARHVIYRPYSKFPSVDRYVDTGRLEKHRASILVEMPYERHTVRHEINIPVEHDRDLMKTAIKHRWDPFKEEPIRHSAGLYAVMRKIIALAPERLEALKEVMKKHPRVIVFYNFDYELEVLRDLEGVEIAEWNGHKHQEIPDSERWVYLVQYTAGAEGWECIKTNATFFFTQTYSYKQWEQAKGRIDRLTTPFTNLYYYLPMSKAFIDLAIRRSIDQKKSFNEPKMSDLS
jgi:superfamily II DNA or RNA helicase